MRLAAAIAALVVLLVLTTSARAESPLEQRGCVACHSLDGSPKRGPTFRGLFGASRTVQRGAAPATVTADHAYLAQSIRSPDADVVVGYDPGSMPAFALADADLAPLVDAIAELRGDAEPAAPRSVGLLAASALAFVGLHLGLSSLPVRRRVIRSVGEGAFQGIYSLVALASFIGIIVGFRQAPYVALWHVPRALRLLPNLLVPIAFVLLVCSVTTKSPTMAGKPGAPPTTSTVGIVRITRHPMLWAFLLWSLSHLVVNGDLRSLVLFGSFALLSVAGMLHIDARRAAAFPDEWRDVAAKTSAVPFAAIAAGKNHLELGEIGVYRLLGGLLLWAASLHLHKMIIGLSPLP